MINIVVKLCFCAMLSLATSNLLDAQENSKGPRADLSTENYEQVQFFERRIRPLLAENCFECHRGKTRKGSLSLESRAHLLVGGDSGPAIVPGDPKASLLIKAVHYQGLEMPPLGKLPERQVKLLEAWIQAGAVWPASKQSTSMRDPGDDEAITQVDREHWSFQPILPSDLTELPGQVAAKNPIDYFIDRRLSAEGLEANPPAPIPTLVRRAYFGLTGLPPTFSELERWSRRIGGEQGTNFKPFVFGKLIDELLERSAYGEHWARHWLDVVRFAQSNGYERDGYKPYSWRYRDYVVRSFQQDKPYDRFILEQIAGDELPDSDDDSRTATAFYRLGVWDDEPDDSRQAEFDELDDIMVTMGAAFLGLTVGCARCHDHKFDPIPQADYYRLLAFLRNIQRYKNPETKLDSSTAIPLGENATIRHAVDQLREREHQREQAIAQATSEADRKQAEARGVDPHLPGLEWTLAVREHPGTPPDTHVLIRGDAGMIGPRVQPGFPEVFSSSFAESAADLQSIGQRTVETAFESKSPLDDLLPSSGRRLALAQWIVDPRHPMTSRVIVNRVWHYHFGVGLVATTGDFGRTGDLPSHPKLLDWLAADFMKHGWSIKRLHRIIMSSAVYQRSSRIDLGRPEHQMAIRKDPGNRLLWRASLRRLQAEAIRDRMLFSSGELNATVGGREFYPRLSGEVLAGQSRPGLDWEVSGESDQMRRSLYAIVKRSVGVPLLETFDYSNNTSPLTERPTTTVATQALILLHGHFTADRAAKLAFRLRQSTQKRASQIEALYEFVLQRKPTERERQVSLQALSKFEDDYRRSSGRISFRPDVPVSLYSGYRQQLSGDACLLGPSEDWDYHAGVWGGTYEGIDVLDSRLGPHAFWRGGNFRNGTLRGKIRFESSVKLATLIACGQPKDTAWQGIGITFDPARGMVEWRDRTAAEENSRAIPTSLPADHWLPFHWMIEETRIRFWLGVSPDGPALIDEAIVAEDITPGQLGVAVWGGQVQFEDLEWVGDRSIELGSPISVEEQEVSGEEQEVSGEEQEVRIRQQALAALARTLFNLSEFVYVE